MVYTFSFFLLYSFFIRKGSLRENPYFFLFSSFFLFTSRPSQYFHTYYSQTKDNAMFIKLTKLGNGKSILVNTNHVKGFFSSYSTIENMSCTDVQVEGGCVEVNETVEEIQEMLKQNEEYRGYVKLIKEVPDVH